MQFCLPLYLISREKKAQLKAQSVSPFMQQKKKKGWHFVSLVAICSYNRSNCGKQIAVCALLNVWENVKRSGLFATEASTIIHLEGGELKSCLLPIVKGWFV